mmetsp:Transcript_47946/g.104296  ORF Transcript_47946/g.104296 Transcript_47946/m.104296 type:complete len:529 (-) Transcript_47946:101-1687(-)
MGRSTKSLSYRVKGTSVGLRNNEGHDPHGPRGSDDSLVKVGSPPLGPLMQGFDGYPFKADDQYTRGFVPNTPSPFLHLHGLPDNIVVPPFGCGPYGIEMGLPPAFGDDGPGSGEGFEGQDMSGMYMPAMMYDPGCGAYISCNGMWMHMDPSGAGNFDAMLSGQGDGTAPANGIDGQSANFGALGMDQDGVHNWTQDGLMSEGGHRLLPDGSGWIATEGDISRANLPLPENGDGSWNPEDAAFPWKESMPEGADWTGENCDWADGGDWNVDGQDPCAEWAADGQDWSAAGSKWQGDAKERNGETQEWNTRDGHWKDSQSEGRDWSSDASPTQQGTEQARPAGRGKGRARKQQEREYSEGLPGETVPVSEGPVGYTTVMLRNIPNKYTREMLVKQLNQDFRGEFDFVYLPIDFKNRCNVGYGFINFRTVETCEIFVSRFNGIDVRKCLPGLNSKKVAEVTPARVQGLEENVRRLRNSPVMNELAHHPEWMPLLLDEVGEETLFPLPEQPCPPVKPRRRGREELSKAAAEA